MFKSLRVFTLAITLLVAFLPVLAACNNTQSAALITPAPTIAATNPIATIAAAPPAAWLLAGCITNGFGPAGAAIRNHVLWPGFAQKPASGGPCFAQSQSRHWAARP